MLIETVHLFGGMVLGVIPVPTHTLSFATQRHTLSIESEHWLPSGDPNPIAIGRIKAIS